MRERMSDPNFNRILNFRKQTYIQSEEVPKLLETHELR